MCSLPYAELELEVWVNAGESLTWFLCVSGFGLYKRVVGAASFYEALRKFQAALLKYLKHQFQFVELQRRS